MFDSSKSQDTELPATREPIVLKIRGCGNIASFKNRKRSVGNKLITHPEMKKRMDAVRLAFEYALLAVLATRGAETSMAARQQFLTRSLPLDDCWTQIPELIVTGELVPLGEEGVDVTIERID